MKLDQRSGADQVDYDEMISMSEIMDKRNIETLNILSRQVGINDYVEKNVESVVSQYFGNNLKVLGVVSRGSDYRSVREFGHSIQPEADILIPIVERKMTEWGMQRIYLKTEEVSVLSKFKELFGDILLYSNQMRYNDLPEGVRITDVNLGREHEKYQCNLEYLTEIVTISMCDSIIGAVNAGLKVASIMNGGKYENVEILDFGVYSDAARFLNKNNNTQ